MIKRIEIQGIHTKVDDALRAYATKKLGGLDKYLSKHATASSHLEVTFKEEKPKQGGKLAHCDVMLHLPHETITIKESAATALAAVDVVESKLKIQLRKYKDLHEKPALHRRLITRLRQRRG